MRVLATLTGQHGLHLARRPHRSAATRAAVAHVGERRRLVATSRIGALTGVRAPQAPFQQQGWSLGVDRGKALRRVASGSDGPNCRCPTRQDSHPLHDPAS